MFRFPPRGPFFDHGTWVYNRLKLKNHLHLFGISYSLKQKNTIAWIQRGTSKNERSPKIAVEVSNIAGWWFGICFIHPYIVDNHPSWLIFLEGDETTNQIAVWSSEYCTLCSVETCQSHRCRVWSQKQLVCTLLARMNNLANHSWYMLIHACIVLGHI